MFLPWKMGRPVVADQKFEQTTSGYARQSFTSAPRLTPIGRFAGLATMTTMMAGCGAGLLSEGVSGLSSTAVALDAGQTYTFDARTAGTTSVTWSLAGEGCVGASCGQLSSTTGGSVQYTAPTTVAKQQSVTLSAKLSGPTTVSTTATIALNPHLAVTAGTLPSTAIGQAYSASVKAQGGMAPYRWSVASGSLPAGLALNPATGEIAGTATGSGVFTFAARVSDASAVDANAQENFTVRVGGTGNTPLQAAGSLSLGVVGSPLTIETTTLPSANLGLSYSATISATGGTAPYSCAVTSGALPSGLVLNGCSIGGRMTGGNGSSFTIRVTDAGSPAKTADGRFTISLAAQPLVLLSRALTTGTQGVSYRTNIAVLGGVGPYHCTTTGGALPGGVAMEGCSVAGIPTAPGSGSVTVQVTDAQSPAAVISGDLSWIVSPAGFSLTTKTLPNGTVGVPYSGPIVATGGTPPYTCSVASSLPSGLSMTGCSVTGIPSVATVVPVTVRLNDSGSPTGSLSASYVFTIAPASIALATTTLPAATAGVPYSAGVIATGGVAPYTCSIAGGALPAGLTLNGCTVAGHRRMPEADP